MTRRTRQGEKKNKEKDAGRVDSAVKIPPARVPSEAEGGEEDRTAQR